MLTLNTPALPQPFHLINRERLRLVKRGAVLINTARGSVVGTTAPLWALDEGILAGAGLDVLEGEEYLREELQVLGQPDSRTPRIGSATWCRRTRSCDGRTWSSRRTWPSAAARRWSGSWKPRWRTSGASWPVSRAIW